MRDQYIADILMLLNNQESLTTADKHPSELVRAHKIFEMDNVVFTPHNAFNSKEALLRILDTTIKNCKEGKENCVNDPGR